MKKTKFWIVLFAVLFAAGCGLFLLFKYTGSGGRVAEIWIDGELTQTIDLEAVTIPYEFDVTSEYGTNTVRAEHGGIAVVAADCPDQICVRQGEITDSYVPIVCIPHRLVIKIRGDQ